MPPCYAIQIVLSKTYIGRTKENEEAGLKAPQRKRDECSFSIHNARNNITCHNNKRKKKVSRKKIRKIDISTSTSTSRAHLIRLGSVERIPRGGEFLRNNVTKIHQGLQAFLEGLNGVGGIWLRSDFLSFFFLVSCLGTEGKKGV